ncbi:universal stress protein [Zestomonas thermotolerans]|uniref:universal stress protein n=1 Tax=Zestomonas thermotolerans TaxID=157784 RepID=UPI0004827BC6|nr:universal stress protein [Pseudomonas thermotolerans]
MANLRQILAATDLSSPSRQAVRRAALQAKECGARLDLLHVLSRAPFEKLRNLVTDVPPGLEERLEADARDELVRLAERLHQDYGVSAGVHVVTGSLLAEIENQTDALRADLLAVGGRGEGFMRHRVLGSTAERLVSKTRSPLLVVKQPARQAYRTLLVPVDFSSVSAATLRLARDVAPGAEIVLLHVFEVPFEGRLRLAGVKDEVLNGYRVAARQEALSKLQALAEQARLASGSVRFLVLQGNPERRILEQEQDQACDLIVIGKHGEGQLEELLLGSTTRQVLAESQCDVLVVV